jgi:glutamate--cysteine ligase
MTAALSIDRFATTVRDRLFRPSAPTVRRIGAEIELLPLLAESGAACPLAEPLPGDVRSTLGFVRTFAGPRGWCEQRSSKGAPYFSLPNDATLTFEPGGQIELCSRPCGSASRLIAELRQVLDPMVAEARHVGIDLASVGIDPRNDLASVPLQLDSERYRRMTAYFESRGPSGVRMMRQTAATQISVDAGADPSFRWRLLCDLAPYLTAIFANSSRYAGRVTGYRSFRAHCWRTLDPSRTGIPYPDAPAEEAYTRFALEATDIMRVDEGGAYRGFGEWAACEDVTEAQWETHLTTLFPEVRPRGHLELRSLDALPPEWLAAPIVLVTGLIYDEASAAAARDLMPSADESLLARAARCGLRDGEIGSRAETIVTLGMRGAKALGTDFVAASDLAITEAFFDRWTSRGLSPADDWDVPAHSPGQSGA